MTQDVSFKQQAFSAFGKGFAIMCLQAPFVNPLNRLSVVCSNTGYSTLFGLREILAGRIDNQQAPKRSLWNLQRGLPPHFYKEIPRLLIKPPGAAFLKPKVDEMFPSSPLKASMVFASIMSLMEIVINPFDTIRVRLQSGQSLSTLWPNPMKQLYAGSWGNFWRQFGTWGIFSFSGNYLDRALLENTTLNTKSFDGMAIKSMIQATLLTCAVYPIFERLKNELQYNPNLKKEGLSLYKAAFEGVIQRSGARGLAHGLLPKILSNFVLVYGFNWLIENGKAKPIIESRSV